MIDLSECNAIYSRLILIAICVVENILHYLTRNKMMLMIVLAVNVFGFDFD